MTATLDQPPELLSAYGIAPLFSLVEANWPLMMLVTATLLERGRAMHVEQIAERLVRAGYAGTPERLAAAIHAAWRSRTYEARRGTYLCPDGRLGLNVQGSYLCHMVDRLRWMRPPRRKEPPSELPPDAQRLTHKELEQAVSGRPLGRRLSAPATVAALLDVTGGPLPEGEIFAALREAGVSRASVEQRLDLNELARSPLLSRDERGKFELRVGANVEWVRRRVRKYTRDQHRGVEVWHVEYGRHYRARELALGEARRLLPAIRRALIHAVPSPRSLARLAVLDIGRATSRVVDQPTPARVAEILEDFDVLVGFGLRPLLRALELDWERWHLIPLEPHYQTVSRDVAGRRLRVRVTPGRVVTDTLGRKLTNRAQYARWLREGSHEELSRALTEDARSLLALYRHGALHDKVVVAGIPLLVSYRLAAERQLAELVRCGAARALGLDVVVGEPATLEAPWCRARRVTPIDCVGSTCAVAHRNRVYVLRAEEIHAARIAPWPTTGTAGASERAGSWDHVPGSELHAPANDLRIDSSGSLADDLSAERERAVTAWRGRLEELARESGDAERLAEVKRVWGRDPELMEAMANLLIERASERSVCSLFELLDPNGSVLAKTLDWMRRSRELPDAARSFATRQIIRRDPGILSRLAFGAGDSRFAMDALKECVIEWLAWSPPVQPAYFALGTPSLFAFHADHDHEHGSTMLMAHRFAKALVGLTPVAANADLILLLRPGPLRDSLAFELLEEVTFASCFLLDRVRTDVRDSEMRRAYDHASLRLHTALVEAEAPNNPPGRAWVQPHEGTGTRRATRITAIVPARRPDMMLMRVGGPEFGIRQAGLVLELARLNARIRRAAAYEPPTNESNALMVLISACVDADDALASLEIVPRPPASATALPGATEVPIEVAARRVLNAITRALPSVGSRELHRLLKAGSLLESVVPGASLRGDGCHHAKRGAISPP